MTIEEFIKLIVPAGSAGAVIAVVLIFLRFNQAQEKERRADQAAEREYRKLLFEQCHAKHEQLTKQVTAKGEELTRIVAEALHGSTAEIARASEHTRRCAESHESLRPVLERLASATL